MSMRSNGSSTTTDPNQMSSGTRDSGIHSNTDDLATPLTSGRADPRYVYYSFHFDAFEMYNQK